MRVPNIRQRIVYLVCQYEQFLALSKLNHIFDVPPTEHLAWNKDIRLISHNCGVCMLKKNRAFSAIIPF